jgi:hypothetical protein
VVTAVALVALLAADAFVTDALSAFSVALLAGGANHVALARIALHVRIAPEIRLALVAPSAAESWSTLASAIKGIAPRHKNIFLSIPSCLDILQTNDSFFF